MASKLLRLIKVNNLFQSLENSNCVFVCLENLAVQPNSEKVNILFLGGLMPACRPEGLPEGLQFCNFEYNLWGKHAENFDQQMGARYPMW